MTYARMGTILAGNDIFFERKCSMETGVWNRDTPDIEYLLMKRNPCR